MTREELEKVCQDLSDKFDFQVKQVMKLEKENGKLEGKLADLQSEYIELENFHHNEVNKLKAQIEKMKNCFNCAKGDWENRVKCIKSGCINKSKWELKEA